MHRKQVLTLAILALSIAVVASFMTAQRGQAVANPVPIRTQRLSLDPPGGATSPYEVKAVPDNTRFYVLRGQILTLYDVEGTVLRSNTVPGTVNTWAISRNGRAIVLFNGNTFAGYDTGGNQLFIAGAPEQMQCVAIDDNGYFAAGSRNSPRVFQFNPGGGTMTASINMPNLVASVSMARTAGTVAAAVNVAGTTNFFKFMMLGGNPNPTYSTMVNGAPKMVAISADGTQTWASTATDYIYKVETGYSLAGYRLDSISVTDNAQKCMGHSSTSIRVFESGVAVRTNTTTGASYLGSMISSTGNYGVGSTDSKIALFDTAATAPGLPCLWTNVSRFYTCGISNDGNYIVSRCSDNRVYQFDFLDSDLDKLSDGHEIKVIGTNYNDPDTDHDGLNDGYEVITSTTNPLNSDTDGDMLTDGWEIYTSTTNPKNPDHDGDGLTDGAEVITWMTNPKNADTDGDTMPDGWEVTYQLNPKDGSDKLGDPDGDGLLNNREYIAGANPRDTDSDDDGLTDGLEYNTYGTNPANPDSDSDTMPDGWEVQEGLLPMSNDAAGDPDSDGLVNSDEYIHGSLVHTNDTDSDSLLDGYEVHTLGTDPAVWDTDGDIMPDGWEVINGLNPLDLNDADADGDVDQAVNWEEYQNGMDPNDPDTDDDLNLDGDEVFYEWNPLDPSIPITHPVNCSIQYHSVGNTVAWFITDPSVPNGLYWFYIDSILNATGTWVAGGVTITLPVDGLGLGIHQCTLVANDGFSGSPWGDFTDTVQVTVENLASSITNTGNLTYEYMTAGNELEWVMQDSYTGSTSYTILCDDVLYSSGTWISAEPVIVAVDSLLIGTYNFTIIADDGLGCTSQDTLFVMVENVAPRITGSNLTYELNTTGHNIYWNITDPSTDTTSADIYIGGIYSHSVTWTSGVLVSLLVDGLPIGAGYEYSIYADDGLGGWNQFWIYVTVENFLPVITPPANVEYEWNTTGHSIFWTITDESIVTGTYDLYIESTLVDSGSWTNGSIITLDIDGLDIGLHTCMIELDDGYGSIVNDEANITVVNMNPQITSPVDVSYEYSTNGHTITWTITDASIGSTTYSIFIDGIAVETNSWSNGSVITVSIDGLALGLHANCWIQVDDGLGGTRIDEVNVTVFNSVPVISNSGNLTYNHNTTGHVISWTIYDDSIDAATYEVYFNGVLVDSGVWVDEAIVSIPADGLEVGMHNYTIIVLDDVDASYQDEIFVSVLNVAPAIFGPVDITYEQGTTGHSILWLITDASTTMTSFVIIRNGTAIGFNSWTDGIPVVLSIDGLTVGSYSFMIDAYDGRGGSDQDEVIVNVYNVVPAITSPADVLYAQGITGNGITWTVTDPSTDATTYYILRSGITIATGSWASGIGIAIVVDGLVTGSYTYLINASDGLGMHVEDEVTVTVTNTPPSITTPADFPYSFGAAGNSIAWTVTDTNVGITSFVILRNSSAFAVGTWTPGVPISISVDGLSLGTHVFQVDASDGLGGSVQDEVIVTVFNVIPAITSPANVSYVQGTTGHSITWTITDTSTAATTHYIQRSGITIATGSWASGIGITIGVDGLVTGSYTFLINASDGLGMLIEDTVIVTVTNTPPSITTPADFAYFSGTTGNVIQWAVTDPNTGTTNYFIRRNGTIIDSGIWISGAPVSINVDGLAVGSYLYTINASDGFGASVQDEVVLNVVLTNLPPTISSPADVVYAHGTTGHSISWTVTDSTTGTATCLVWNNASFSTNVSWASGVPVTITIDGLVVGSYMYTINSSDGFGMFVVDTVLVNVINVAPAINHPGDIIYNFGATGNSIPWNITDESTGTRNYVIERNNVSVFSGSWLSGAAIGYNVDGLASGVYSIAIIATDGLGGSAIDVVQVIVLNIVPSITSPANVSYNHGATGHAISWSITDSNIGTTSYTVKRDGTVVGTGTWINNTPVAINVDGLAVGTHQYEINASDGLGGSIQDQVIVIVINIAPVISTPSDVVFMSDAVSMNVSWTATDASLSGATFALYKNGTGIAFGAWSSSVPINVNIAFLVPGVYNLTMVVQDGYTGIASDGIIAHIVQSLQPDAFFSANATTIQPGDSIAFLHHGDGGNLPVSYEWSFGDGSANVTMENATHEFITEGTFTVKLVVTDSDGEIASFTITITVKMSNQQTPGSFLDYLTTPSFMAMVLVLSVGLTILGLALHKAHRPKVVTTKPKPSGSKQGKKIPSSDVAIDTKSPPKVPTGYQVGTTTGPKALPLIQASQEIQVQEAKYEELRKDLIELEAQLKQGKLRQEEYMARNEKIKYDFLDLVSKTKE